jgi:hypothetical protein
VCGGTAVQKIEGRFVKSPTHRCPDCGAQLKTVLSLRVLWAIPATLFAVFATYFFGAWIRQLQLVSGLVEVMLLGGFIGLALSLSGLVVWRGIHYRAI